MKLPRTHQCKNCPFKVSVDINTIPNGYDAKAHNNLLENSPKETDVIVGQLNVMACHHSNDRDEMYCIGWLANALGEGNNIPMRIKAMSIKNISKIKTYGKQHKRFEDLKPNK